MNDCDLGSICIWKVNALTHLQTLKVNKTGERTWVFAPRAHLIQRLFSLNTGGVQVRLDCCVHAFLGHKGTFWVLA